MRTAAWLCALAVALALPALLSPSAGAATGVAMACAAVCWLPALWVSTVWLGLRKRNYLGRLLPAGAGLMLPVIVLPTTWLSAAGPEQRAGALIVVGALGAVGLLDDLFGARRQARGLRGHLLSLLRGRVTTGGVKALGGLAAGLAAAALLDRGRPAVIVLDGVLIALAANFVNLLDLRPGRALKGFGLLSAAVAGVAPSSLRVLGPVLAAAVVAAPAEFGGRVMLGEVGANVLGGAAGLALALALSPWQRLVACGALVVVHVVAECASLTELIGRSRWLTLLDHLGTAHLPPFTPEVARQ
jgi:UDP-N-acetylmuramyl pentapeptide phosphotransferase/UDP-N-acetylglucosamine-1-phosphate transferase